MHRLSPTAKKTLAAATLCIASVLIYVGVHALVQKNQQKLITLQVEIAQVQKQEETIRSTRNLIQETRDERNELEAQLLAREDPGTFLELLENLAREAGVMLEVTSLSEEGPRPGVEAPYGGVGSPAVQAVFAIDGSFAQTNHFIAMVEVMPYAVTLDRVALERSKTGGAWSGVLTAHIATR